MRGEVASRKVCTDCTATRSRLDYHVKLEVKKGWAVNPCSVLPSKFWLFFFFFPGHHCLYIYAAVLPLPKCENWLKIDAVVYDVIVYFKD